MEKQVPIESPLYSQSLAVLAKKDIPKTDVAKMDVPKKDTSKMDGERVFLALIHASCSAASASSRLRARQRRSAG